MIRDYIKSEEARPLQVWISGFPPHLRYLRQTEGKTNIFAIDVEVLACQHLALKQSIPPQNTEVIVHIEISVFSRYLFVVYQKST